MGFHYMVAAAGGKEIECADYATFGTQELSDGMVASLGNRRSCLLANHGMICYGPNLDKVLWLANETECLAKQYICALSTGTDPDILPDDEMDVMLAKFKTYGKQPQELAELTEFERCHVISAPVFCGAACCMPAGLLDDVVPKSPKLVSPVLPVPAPTLLKASEDVSVASVEPTPSPTQPIKSSTSASSRTGSKVGNAPLVARSPVASRWLDAATFSIFGHGLSMLVLAFRMSLINMEQMQVARAAGKEGARDAARRFLASTYYRSWSRAQLNNTEYAPMLALLCFCLKFKANRSMRRLTFSESAACISSFAFSTLFIYAAASQGRINHGAMRPGRGGMSPLRPVGALGRYASQAWLLLELLLRS